MQLKELKMATVKYYLDTRATKPGDPAPIRLAIRTRNSAAFLSTDIRVLPSEWDAASGKVIGNARRKLYNKFLEEYRIQVLNTILDLKLRGELAEMSAVQLRRRFLYGEEKSEVPRFYQCAVEHASTKSSSRRMCYKSALLKLEEFVPDLREMTFEDITPRLMREWVSYMSEQGMKPNSISAYLLCVSSVFRVARIDNLTQADPMRGLSLPKEQTRKRSLSLEDLRLLFALRPSKEVCAVGLDIFRLSFFLIGINPVDLFSLEAPVNGRIEYRRAKTGRLYSVQIEPEAMALIEAYRGSGDRLLQFWPCVDYTLFYRRLVYALHHLPVPFASSLSIYWARHTWATLAARLDVPKDTIAAALGHGGNTVTDIYIDFDRSKVDAANRRVIDWVLYGKE